MYSHSDISVLPAYMLVHNGRSTVIPNGTCKLLISRSAPKLHTLFSYRPPYSQCLRPPLTIEQQQNQGIIVHKVLHCLRPRHCSPKTHHHPPPAIMPAKGTSPFATFLIIGRTSSPPPHNPPTPTPTNTLTHSRLLLPRHPLRPLPLRLPRPLDDPLQHPARPSRNPHQRPPDHHLGPPRHLLRAAGEPPPVPARQPAAHKPNSAYCHRDGDFGVHAEIV